MGMAGPVSTSSSKPGFFARLFGGGKSPKKATRHLRVAEITRENPHAVTLHFERSDGGAFDFKPGQYFTLGLDIDGVKVRRSYSASSVPGAPRLSLTIKRVDNGICSTFINSRVKVDDLVDVIGPVGSFFVDPATVHGRELVLIAGGSGITPIMSIIASALATDASCRIALIYGNRSSDHVIFEERLRTLAAQHADRLTVRHVLQTPPDGWQGGTGMLDTTVLDAELGRVAPSAKADYYICGPEPVLAAAGSVLAKRGVAAEHIHVEKFTTAVPRPAGQFENEKVIVRSGNKLLAVLDVPAGRTLLDVALDHDLPLPFTCAGGQCGDCQVRMLRGEVEIAEPNCLPRSHREDGYILTCSSRPKSEVEIDIEDTGEQIT